MHVAGLGVDDARFLAELAERVHFDEQTEDADIVFLAANEPADVERLAELKEAIKRDGAVWVVYHKGQKEFGERDVLRLGLESGTVDVKVVRFSDTHTATKFVIRRSER